MKRLKQSQIAKELGISKSYLSMILSGERKCPPELVEKLQSIPGIHKVVNNPPWVVPSKQGVAGSNPVSRSSFARETISSADSHPEKPAGSSRMPDGV